MKKFRSKEGEIAYEVKGAGNRNFLLIHNSGGSHEMMCHSIDYFSSSSKVVAPDLLGHGMSASPKTEYTLSFFAKSLIELCEAENLKQIIFVGLNYGADIGIAMAQIAPDLISSLVLLEPPIFMEPWIRELVEQQVKNLQNPREGWAQQIVDSVIMNASDDERETALKALKLTPSFVKMSSFEYLLKWDKEHLFSCSIPTLLIQSSQPFCTEQQARTVFSKLQIGRVVGSGPWVNLETPAQVHAMIDRFLELI